MTRRHRVAAAAVAVCALPALTACNSSGADPATTASCEGSLATPTMDIPLTSIHANVWNASGKSGLAADIASQLSWRGIKIISEGNDPTAQKPPTHAEIRFGANGKQIALTVAEQIKDATLEQDDRTNPSVDIVLGTKFALVPVPPPKPSKITVNVLNAYVIRGSASGLANTLRKRGFHVAKVSNAHGAYYPKHAAVIRYGLRGEPAARRLKLQFRDVRMINDGRDGEKVDVVIGSKWNDKAVVPAAKATPPPTTKAPSPTCSPIRTASATGTS